MAVLPNQLLVLYTVEATQPQFELPGVSLFRASLTCYLTGPPGPEHGPTGPLPPSPAQLTSLSCPVCNPSGCKAKPFPTAKLLREHLQAVHDREQCTICLQAHRKCVWGWVGYGVEGSRAGRLASNTSVCRARAVPGSGFCEGAR